MNSLSGMISGCHGIINELFDLFQDYSDGNGGSLRRLAFPGAGQSPPGAWLPAHR